MLLRALIILILLAAGTAFAAENKSCDGTIEIESAWARISPSEPGTVSIFFDVVSLGETDDSLIAATSSMARKATLRQGVWKGLNFSNQQKDGLVIKAGKRVEFRAGVSEVTLTEMDAAVSVGTAIPVTLLFKNAGEITIEAQVGNQLLGNRGRK
jgi:copper(I)-binding protein